MRHLLANLATYSIALLLLAGAGLFAWVRSSQVAITDERTLFSRYDPTGAREFRWQELGEQAYRANCMNCHGAGGQGWDQYPPLTDVPALLAAPGGREYLVDLHLYGLTSHRWRAPMPPMGHMQDVQLAAALNYVVTRFGAGAAVAPELFTPEEIARRRGLRRAPSEVERDRPGNAPTPVPR